MLSVGDDRAAHADEGDDAALDGTRSSIKDVRPEHPPCRKSPRFPVVTCILISVVLSLVAWLIRAASR
jgi:hypothetical protein